MPSYKVKSGQNIYDIALSLYGSVEGIFYLLAANRWLNLDMELTRGMELEYSEDLVINNDIVIWLKENNVRVKNGNHQLEYLDVEPFVEHHFQDDHDSIYNNMQSLSPDEQTMYWETLTQPRMIIQQQGSLSTMIMQLLPDTHLIIDWGDYSDPQIIEGEEFQEVEHCYKGNGSHTIVFYGDFRFNKLDFTNLNGVYYPLNTIYVNEFITPIDNENINKLIIPQE